RRDPVLSGGGRHMVDVDVYEADEAPTYLRQRLATAGKAHLLGDRAGDLARALGWLPLALSQAAAYMIGQRVTCGAYLDLYTAGSGKLDELMPDDPDGHTRSITVTLLLALDAADAQATAGLARPAMDLAAVLDPAGAACAYLTAYRTRITAAPDPGGDRCDHRPARGGACAAVGGEHAPMTPPDDIEDTDPGLARERTELAWPRTAISFAALGGVILKSHPYAGIPVLALSAANEI